MYNAIAARNPFRAVTQSLQVFFQVAFTLRLYPAWYCVLALRDFIPSPKELMLNYWVTLNIGRLGFYVFILFFIVLLCLGFHGLSSFILFHLFHAMYLLILHNAYVS